MAQTIEQIQKKNETYWHSRRVDRLIASEQKALLATAKIFELYDQAERNIARDIKSIYDNYSKDGVLDVSELKKVIGKEGVTEFKRRIAAATEKMGTTPDKIYDERYLDRLTRLQALQEQIKLEAMSSAYGEEKTSTELYKDILRDNYKKSQQDLKRQGITPSFTTLDTRMTNTILNSMWAKGNYSTRIWGNNNKLATRLPTIIGAALTAGQSYANTATQLRERYDVARYEAVRLVRTESNYFYNQAELQSYVDDGIKTYTLDVTLDGRTSTICLAIDEKHIYEVSKATVGKNYPPLHPQCRTVPRPKLDEDKKAKKTRLVDRADRLTPVTNNEVKNKWNAAMKAQMDPTKAAHDYNADMNILTQKLKAKEITQEDFGKELNSLMARIPKDYPLRGGLETVAKLNGWTPPPEPKHVEISENFKTLVGQNIELTQFEKNIIDAKGITLSTQGAKSTKRGGQYSAGDNEIKLFKVAGRDPDAMKQTFFHELGHAISYNLGGGSFTYGNKVYFNKLSSTKEFGQAIRANEGQGFNNVIFERIRQSPSDSIANLSSLALGDGVDGKRYPRAFLKYIKTNEEIFAEGYKLYRTRYNDMKDKMPELFKYYDNLQ